MARILVLRGSGRYSDPWHPFDETSAALSSVLRDDGHEVGLRDTTPEAFTFDDLDLVVVNSGCGDPHDPPTSDPDWDAAFERFGEWIERGGKVLATHTGAATFPDWVRWTDILGGAWVRGVSSHPERSLAVFEAVPEAADHPVVAGLAPVIAYDERYSFLDVHLGSVPLLRHETGEQFHTVVWAKGDSVVYDGLGHDGRSYASSGRRELVRREVGWLLG